MEACFGSRGSEGWEVWIRGDQLNLLVRDFRKVYVGAKASKSPKVKLLDLWVEDLLKELKRM